MRNRSVNKKKMKKRRGGSLKDGSPKSHHKPSLVLKLRAPKYTFKLHEVIKYLGKILLVSELIHGVQYYYTSCNDKYQLGTYDSEMKLLVFSGSTDDMQNAIYISIRNAYTDTKNNHQLIFENKGREQINQNFQNKEGIPIHPSLIPKSGEFKSANAIQTLKNLYEILFDTKAELQNDNIIKEGINLLHRFHNENITHIMSDIDEMIKFFYKSHKFFDCKLKDPIKKYYKYMFFIKII